MSILFRNWMTGPLSFTAPCWLKKVLFTLNKLNSKKEGEFLWLMKKTPEKHPNNTAILINRRFQWIFKEYCFCSLRCTIILVINNRRRINPPTINKTGLTIDNSSDNPVSIFKSEGKTGSSRISILITVEIVSSKLMIKVAVKAYQKRLEINNSKKKNPIIMMIVRIMGACRWVNIFKATWIVSFQPSFGSKTKICTKVKQ